MTAATFCASLRRVGRPMELKRRIGTTSAFTACTVYGKDRGYHPAELVGGVIQGDRRIRIAQADIVAAAWPGPPKKNDLLDGGAVQGIQPLYDRGAVVGFAVWVRG
jgi:hypothetical protein